MEQRPLRLGDLVDDYCPRERRVTNHAIVAIVGEEIRQTRCSTCDVEHVYKHARMPKRGLGKDGQPEAPGTLVPRVAPKDDSAVVPMAAGAADPEATANPASDPASNGTHDPSPSGGDERRDVDGWLAHRPLIRATLPRVEGDVPPPRPIPEFTMHQRQYGRPFRHGPGRPGGAGNGNGFGSRHDRFGSQGNPGNGNANGNHGHQGNHGNPGNGESRPPGGGRRRRRRGGRHKPSN
jgi:hypothetical protein